MAISPLQVGPPTRRRELAQELAPGHAPLIFDREALRAPADTLCRHKYARIVAEWLSQLSISLRLPAR